MKVRIQVVIESENGEPEKVEEIARLERGALRQEELGLTLAEAKALLHSMESGPNWGLTAEAVEASALILPNSRQKNWAIFDQLITSAPGMKHSPGSVSDPPHCIATYLLRARWHRRLRDNHIAIFQ